jgi:phosphoglycerol transferase
MVQEMSPTLSIYLSLSLFIPGVYLFRKTKSLTKNISFYAMVIVSVTCYLMYAISDYFTGNGIDESVLFYLKYGLTGAGFLEYIDIIAQTAAAIILVSILLVWLLLRRVKSHSHWIFKKNIPFLLLLLSLTANPAIADVYSIVSYSYGTTITKKYYRKQHITKLDELSFQKYYLEPSINKITNETKNLVFIYAESLERTYFDETIFPGLITGLRELESKSTYFTNIREASGTGWTIGGMVASQCGIPLFAPAGGNSMAGMDVFLPSAVCLGDLLHDQGYNLTYYGGAELVFGGKGKFYSTHKFDLIAGRDELLPFLADKSYISGWGLYDDSLIDLAYKRFVELSELDENFVLFLLTLDTHHPNGHPSKSCQGIIYQDGSNPMLNAVACSDYLITEFVEKIMESPYGERTIVVVLSDHLALRNTAYNDLTKRERKNLFMIIEPKVNKPTKVEKLGSALDIAPTILPFLGYEGFIGLGRNLRDTGYVRSDIEKIQRNLLVWEPMIANFWNFPKVRNFVEIDIAEKTLRIDDRTFDIPVLIEFTNELETSLVFLPHWFVKGREKIIHDRLMGDENRPFILVDHCTNLYNHDKNLGNTGFCLVAANGQNYAKKLKLYGTVKFTSDGIRELLKLEPNFQPLRVAHAGGGINGKTYTNSLEALDHNLKNGFSYFELDFSFTKDRQLVCIHDWKQNFNRVFGFLPKEKPTLEAFELLVKDKSEFKPCTLETLANWMEQNTSAFIITDMKEDNLEGLRIIAEKISEFKRRIIPQIYDPRNYNEVKGMGYEQIIWTLYRYNGSSDEVLRWTEKFNGLFAITMPKDLATSDLPKKLADKHIPTYVHTINTLDEMNRFVKDFGVTEIYTDFLRPES